MHWQVAFGQVTSNLMQVNVVRSTSPSLPPTATRWGGCTCALPHLPTANSIRSCVPCWPASRPTSVPGGCRSRGYERASIDDARSSPRSAVAMPSRSGPALLRPASWNASCNSLMLSLAVAFAERQTNGGATLLPRSRAVCHDGAHDRCHSLSWLDLPDRARERP